MIISREIIEEDYNRIKKEFQTHENLSLTYKIAEEIKEYREIFRDVFSFLISAFKGKLRNDGKTPLVFHSVYLTKLAYSCGEKRLDSLLIIALHDILEDTDISEKGLMQQKFMLNKRYLISYLRILKENKNLSREPDGEHLPPRYIEHIKRLIGAPKKIINTEILDRFSDLMDLEYITNLPKKEKEMRLKSKLIKVKSFIYNIIRGGNNYNKDFLYLFNSKVKELEERLKIKVSMPLIIP